ncbi:MAG: hypothetical protein ACK54E_06485 [Pseudanabaena sp.]
MLSDRLEITTHGTSDRLYGDEYWGDRLEIMTYGNSDRFYKIDC